MRKFLMVALLASAASTSAFAEKENYIKLPSGYITTKHECSADDAVCVDCTFLDDQTCYEQANKAGLIDKNVGSRSGQQLLKPECDYPGNTSSLSKSLGNGKFARLICPVAGAVAVAAPPKPKRHAEPYMPDESPGGDAAVGIFFAQKCPGYITDGARQHIHTVSQFKAREAWKPYHDIESSLFSAAEANGTSPQQELKQWCISAEERIWNIQQKLGEVLGK